MTSPPRNEQLLVVDDESAVRRTLRRILERIGYECDLAGTVAEARRQLDDGSYGLMICDLKMPGEDGMVLVEEVLESDREIAVLVVTGVDDPAIARAATQHGVDGYLLKPFTSNELEINVDYALEQSRRRHSDWVEGRMAYAGAGYRDRAGAVRSAMIDATTQGRILHTEHAEMLARLSEAVALRDIETGDHIRRIGRHSETLARMVGVPGDEARDIGMAAPMHDVGKVATPDAILLKPGPLTAGEREVMQRHTEVGREILSHSGSPLLDMAADIAYTHHERFDGEGYPRGISGEDIPISGRIVAVADVFDALTSDRPYRDALPVELVIETMSADRGSHFDPELLDCFLGNVDRFETGDTSR